MSWSPCHSHARAIPRQTGVAMAPPGTSSTASARCSPAAATVDSGSVSLSATAGRPSCWTRSSWSAGTTTATASMDLRRPAEPLDHLGDRLGLADHDHALDALPRPDAARDRQARTEPHQAGRTRDGQDCSDRRPVRNREIR